MQRSSFTGIRGWVILKLLPEAGLELFCGHSVDEWVDKTVYKLGGDNERTEAFIDTLDLATGNEDGDESERDKRDDQRKEDEANSARGFGVLDEDLVVRVATLGRTDSVVDDAEDNDIEDRSDEERQKTTEDVEEDGHRTV